MMSYNHPVEWLQKAYPGRFFHVEVSGDALLVGCGDGRLLCLDEVQMEGKRRVSAAEFLRGNQVRSGERLGL